MKPLQDRVAVVTGASRGLGQAFAEALAAEGAKMVLAARTGDEIEAHAAAMRQAGGEALAVPTDVRKEADIVALFKAAVDKFGRVDVLVNNAGIAKGGPTEELPLSTWEEMLNVNLTSAFLCSREAMKIMKRQKGGRIINIGSISSITPRPNAAPYAATKSALEGLTRSLAFDGRDHGIAASIIYVGAAATSFMRIRPEEATGVNYHMAPSDVARVVVLMVTLPPEVNMFDATILPVQQPSFIGRG